MSYLLIVIESYSGIASKELSFWNKNCYLIQIIFIYCLLYYIQHSTQQSKMDAYFQCIKLEFRLCSWVIEASSYVGGSFLCKFQRHLCYKCLNCVFQNLFLKVIFLSFQRKMLYGKINSSANRRQYNNNNNNNKLYASSFHWASRNNTDFVT